MSCKEIAECMKRQHYLDRAEHPKPFTATEILLRHKEAADRWQRDVVEPFMAPMVDRMYSMMVEQGIVVANMYLPELLWWEKVLRWNPCNTFVEDPHVQFQIEPRIYL